MISVFSCLFKARRFPVVRCAVAPILFSRRSVRRATKERDVVRGARRIPCESKGADNDGHHGVPTQLSVGEGARGRVLGVYGIVWRIQPPSGTKAAFLSQCIGVARAAAVGGVGIIAIAVIAAALNPGLRGLRTGGAAREAPPVEHKAPPHEPEAP